MPTKLPTILCAALTTLCLAGCGDDSGDDGAGNNGPAPSQNPNVVNCDTETRAQTYTANMALPGEGGVLSFQLVESAPAPPAKGQNHWTLILTDSDGAVMDGATLEVTPFMPDHGHGTSVNAEITPAGSEGRYEIDPVNLWMPGYWTIDIDATVPDGAVDRAVFKFCIPG